MTDIELQLLTDINQHLYIEEGIRGGVAMISHRYARSNLPQQPNFQPDEPLASLIYLDANNLYGWAMSQPLPTHDFKWLDATNIQSFDVRNISDDNDTGYILEVDLGMMFTLNKMLC